MKKSHIIGAIALLALSGCSAQNEVSAKNDAKSSSSDNQDLYRLTSLILGVNWTREPKISISIEPPSGFQLLLPITETYNKEVTELVRKGATTKDWKEKFSIISQQGKGFQAEQYSKEVLKEIKETAADYTVIESLFSKESDFGVTICTSAVEYIVNGRRELLVFLTVSGPLDLVMVKYTAVVNQKTTKKTASNLLDMLFSSARLVSQ